MNSTMKNNTFAYKTHQELIDNFSVSDIRIKDLIKEIQTVYSNDDRPWIIGFSGGKDSTAVLSLIYGALLALPITARKKHIYVVSSDTLVETPVVVDMIKGVLDRINQQASNDNIPMSAHPVHPKADQTFWVNLLGRGYPAPKQTFRWCTERLKINPVSTFITEKVDKFGEAIVVLGSRSQESSSRAQVIEKHKIEGSYLSRHNSLANAYIYMPIEKWSADDVWGYLMSAPCPWGGSNQKLFELYKGSNQGECPLVIDTSTPSCGNSRFGCWTCTVVSEDKAIHGLIESGDKWMQPLLDFRNALFESTIPENKNKYRNFKRRTGKVTYANNDSSENENTISNTQKHIPGPYWLKQRQSWLKELLQIEKNLRDTNHHITLVREEELHAIRQHWLRDPNEPDWADSLPRIYSEVYDTEIDWIENDAGAFTEPDAILLKELGGKYNIPAELIMKLIEVELSVSGLGKRTGILRKIDSVLRKDWGSLEEINTKNLESKKHNLWEEQLENLQKAYKEVPEV